MQGARNHAEGSEKRTIIIPSQGAFKCGILVSGIGGSEDPRRKWENERGREKKKRKVLLLFAK